MAAVLLKVSGSSRVTEDGALAEAMKNPSRYVQQYRYRSEGGDGASGGRLLLYASFDPASIDGLLRQHDFTVWGDARPSTLIWLGVEDQGSRVLVGAKDGGLLRDLIGREAARRALPVELPRLDSRGGNRVTTADIWGEFLEPIKEASQSYDAQAILVGRLFPLSSRRWEARWTLLYQGKAKRWQEQAVNATSLITEAMGRVTDHLSQSFAQSFVAGRGELLVRVEDVGSLEDYRRVIDYLKGVHGVKRVTTEALSHNVVRLRVSTAGGSEAVRQVIALGNTLKRVTRMPMRYAPGGSVGTGQRMSQEALPPGAAAYGRQTAPSGAIDPEAGAAPPQPDVVYRLQP
jgi:hypothetical protein